MIFMRTGGQSDLGQRLSWGEFTSEGLDGWLHEENFSIDTKIRLQD